MALRVMHPFGACGPQKGCVAPIVACNIVVTSPCGRNICPSDSAPAHERFVFIVVWSNYPSRRFRAKPRIMFVHHARQQMGAAADVCNGHGEPTTDSAKEMRVEANRRGREVPRRTRKSEFPLLVNSPERATLPKFSIREFVNASVLGSQLFLFHISAI